MLWAKIHGKIAKKHGLILNLGSISVEIRHSDEISATEKHGKISQVSRTVLPGSRNQC